MNDTYDIMEAFKNLREAAREREMRSKRQPEAHRIHGWDSLSVDVRLEANYEWAQ